MPQIFTIYLVQCPDSSDDQCHKLILNDHEIASTQNSDISNLSLLINDLDNDQHTISIRSSPLATVGSTVAAKSVSARVEVLQIDGREVFNKSFSISLDTSQPSVATLIDASGGIVELREPLDHCAVMMLPEDSQEFTSQEAYIVHEIEAIRLLEKDAERLQQEIASRKDAASVRLAKYHANVPLKDLMDRCDDVVCTAKAIANRLYEKLTLALSSNDRYQPLQNPLSMEKSPAQAKNINETSYETLPHLSHGSTNLLLQALTCIASLLGLVTLFSFLKRKCMSPRRRLERLADLEERQAARAYRCAARQEAVRRRWSAFRKLFCLCKHSCPSSKPDYDEKRAMILQDALLQEHPEQFARGDIMEAEIRQLRHARSIVAGIVSQETRKPLNKDPPPNLVPLPHTARSRSSTSTLPPYDIESLPDYSSLPDDLQDEIVMTDGFDHYRPPTSEAGSDFGHHAAHTALAQGPLSISSVAALSPRASNETLRTRTTSRSRAGSHDMSRLIS